ncbi:MAG: hypothetical protein RBQ84_11350 [Arcobacter sp.]|jgi:hypothetical protein|uniref:hypothetical protein n=1 Tax=unclassified Arcobacter TaxID=2593671 RepID=UPI000229635E|nr:MULTISPECIES: hypothetical protein [unclassified Arcobacter]MDY3201542.1 hypothetical protein [Arcobacter sp.]BAK73662.1 hypothetical protein ABLL_1787 [Arcobacter sp. L]
MILENKKKYLSRLFKGEIPLIIVFWLWFVFISICIEICLQVNLIRFESEYLQFFIYFMVLIYSIAIFYITFKSASKYTGLKVWSFLAKIIVTINLFFSLALIIEIYKYYFLEDYLIGKDIEDFKNNLPIQVDANSILIDIYKKEKTIFYVYTLIGVDLTEEKSKNIFKKQINDSLCDSETTLSLLKKDYILSYKYTNENDEEIINIETKKENCGDSIYDLDIVSNLLEKQGV